MKDASDDDAEPGSVDPPADPLADHAAATLRARVASRVADVMAARARVVEPSGGADGAGDTEAVHDYRVGLRRLRSALRALRAMWTKRILRPLEQALKALADATGDVRDEEVLEETLAKLKLEGETSQALAVWRRGRSRRLLGARRVAARKLAGADLGGQLKQTLHAVEVVMATPPAHPLTLHRLAKRSVGDMLANVFKGAMETDKDDVEGMHALRICVKRLRYGIELVFEGGATSAALKAAAKLQKRLGELHDLDEAKVRIGRSWGLDKQVRCQIADRLADQRHKVANKAARDLDDAVPDLVEEVHALIASLDVR